MASNTVWGLDIGSSAIKVVKMVKDGPGCKIVAFDIIDIPPGETEADRPARLQATMGELVGNHKFGSDPVFVAVPGSVCLHKEFQLPPGSEDKMRDLVQYEVRQQIPYPLEQIEWGFEKFDDASGGVGVALIAVRKNDIKELLALLDMFKLNVRGITAAPVSLFNFIHHEFTPEGTTLILDSGAKGTDFVVMNKRQIYFRTIQIAGREITKVLENKFKVPYEKAEDLKKNIAKSPQVDKILSVIEPTLRQLGGEVQRTMGFYKAKAKGQRIQQCYLLGHTFRLPKMADTLQTQVRDAPFTLVEGLQKVKIDHTINVEVWNNEFPTMAVAIGLGLQGLGLSELTLNLIPEDVTAGQARDRWKPWMAAAVVVVAATLFLLYSHDKDVNAEVNKSVGELASVVVTANKNKEEESKAIVGLDEMETLAKRWSRVAHDRGKVANAYGKLLALQDNGKAFFGAESKVYVTNLYVSRIPLGAASAGGLEKVEQTSLLAREDFGGPKSIYASLARIKKFDAAGKESGEVEAADAKDLVPELRPDVPLVAVLSGELEAGPQALATLNKLEDALKRLPEVKEVRIARINEGPTYIEFIPEYTWEGAIKVASATSAPAPAAAGAAPAAPTEKKSQYMLFHAIIRWVDKDDPDLEPAEAVAKAPTAKKK